MLLQMNPYLNFDGNCAEAMQFYAGIFGADVQIIRFGDAPTPAPPGTEDRVMHSMTKIGDTSLMASDTMPDMPLTRGSNVYISLMFDDRDEQTRVFEALAEGGQVDMPLEEQFFGRFGSLRDRFGVRWMTVVETPTDG